MNRILFTLVALTIFVASSAGQSLTQNLVSKDSSGAAPSKSLCRNGHRSQWGFFMGSSQSTTTEPTGESEGIGILPPVSILSFVEKKIEWVHVDSSEVHLGSLHVEDGHSRLGQKVDLKRHYGCYAITYCKKHFVALTIDDLPKEQCKKLG